MVELTVCLPILVTLVLGSIELCNFIYLKQAVCAAAYESAREAVRPSATQASFEAAANEILSARRLTGDVEDGIHIEVTPAVQVPRGELITVTIAADASLRRAQIPQFVDGMVATCTVTMAKE